MLAVMKNQKYSKPVVEAVQIKLNTSVLVNSNLGLGIGTEIDGGEGG